MYRIDLRAEITTEPLAAAQGDLSHEEAQELGLPLFV